MTEKRFQIIHLGNAYDFVVKDHNTNNTYGTFQGDKKQMERLLNDLNEEIVELREGMVRMMADMMTGGKP